MPSLQRLWAAALSDQRASVLFASASMADGDDPDPSHASSGHAAPSTVPAPSLPDPAVTTGSAKVASDSSQNPANPRGEPPSASASPSAANASIPASSAAAAAPLSSSGQPADVDPASEPVIPERNYPKDARLLQYSPPSRALPSSRALPRFLKVLAAVIFVTGTTASICALLYQVCECTVLWHCSR